MTYTPPDWVLIEAANRGGHSWKDQSVRQLRDAYVDVDVPVFNALCDMIAKHEQPPVDRKLLCAEEACIKDGWHITVRTCLHAIELWEQGFGK
jgi:hypothetical protein